MARQSIANTLTSGDLKRASILKEKIEQLSTELDAILGGSSAPAAGAAKASPGRPRKNALPKLSVEEQPAGRKKRRKLSPEAKARIAEGQKRRWALKRQEEGK